MADWWNLRWCWQTSAAYAGRLFSFWIVLFIVHHLFFFCCELAIVSYVACISEFSLVGLGWQVEGLPF